MRRTFVTVLGIVTLLVGGCRPATTKKPSPVASERGARAEDADDLPAFVEDGGEISSTDRFKVELGDAPVRGKAGAPVTVVMFSDFECHFCRQGYLTLRELERRYPKQVRIAYKAFPLDFHSGALPAAIAARTAQAQGKFWEFHDRIFADRQMDLERLFEYAKDVGIDPLALARDLESLDYGPEVRRDMRQARKLGVTSTPTFFINGRPIAGAQPIDELSAVVEQEIERSQEFVAEGVAPGDLYARATRDGYSRVQYTEGRRGLDPDAVVVVPIGKSPALGPAEALVTIVEFGDYECQFCARGHEVLVRLRARYGDKLRIVHKQNPLPFHSHAFMAARATAAAGAQGKFWKFHDALYATGAEFDEEMLVRIAKQVGLDTKRFRGDIQSASFDAAIDDDLALAGMLGVTGTPAYFVNGRPVEGALPELLFRLIVEEEIERAERLLASGVARDKLYETLVRTPLE
ncbi:MAG: thioredoxin domain-containing protein [Deltaproteobacteria bacterium]|nr:thioredoxin domain-containing protein [Nannocystaceae bacterium]